jgi:protein-tyrosine-phosphatase
MSEEKPMHIVFVCTGNTCRSPLAEALMRRALAARGHTSVAVSSAGTGAWEGAPASEGSLLVGLENGLDLSGHRARLLTRELAHAADLILAMSPQQRERVAALGAGDRAHTLSEFAGVGRGDAEVQDPFGSDLDAYRTTYRQLEELVDAVAARIAAGRSGEQR